MDELDLRMKLWLAFGHRPARPYELTADGRKYTLEGLTVPVPVWKAWLELRWAYQTPEEIILTKAGSEAAAQPWTEPTPNDQ